MDLISALPDLCYVCKMERDNTKIKNDLILQNNFPISKQNCLFHRKRSEVPNTKYGDLNQELSVLES